MKNLVLSVILAGTLMGCGNRQAREKQAEPVPEPAGEAVQDPVPDQANKGQGLQYALAVQGTLGKTLQGKIRQAGTSGAIAFCNVHALPITDSIGLALGARISRITDKARNPLNRASVEEMAIIGKYRGQLSSGETPEPLLVRQDGQVHFYYPILTSELCLQCHGTPGSQMDAEVYAELRQLYPDDQATGYSANELRGLWKVAFTEKQP